jgi:hypothetical protein
MLPSIIIFSSIGLGAIIVGIRYLIWGDREGFLRVTAWGIILLLFGGALLLASLASPNRNIWWGTGCPMINKRAGLC